MVDGYWSKPMMFQYDDAKYFESKFQLNRIDFVVHQGARDQATFTAANVLVHFLLARFQA